MDLWTSKPAGGCSKYEGTLKVGGQTEKYPRFSIAGREIIDTLHAVKRWNAITRELSGHGLKEASQHFGLASQGRQYIKGSEIVKTWETNPESVRRYALDDVAEVAGLSDLLMGTSFALATLLPMSFERIATAGTATSIDMMFVRAYLEANHSLPVPMKKRGKFKGGLTDLIRQGVIENVVKADAESLYATDFRELFKTEEDLLSAIPRTIKPIQRVVKAEEKRWIELAHGFKLKSADPKSPVTRRWVSADSADATLSFIKEFDGLDIHRSQLVVHCPQQPTGKHDEYKRSGDFVLEIDGSLTDMDKMLSALSCAHHALGLLKEKLGAVALVRAFFNGGKSIYLFVSGLDPSPVYRLHERHRKFADAIVKELPDELKSFIDLELYDPDQMLRMEGTRYPSGGYNVEIPLSLIEAEDWDAIKQSSNQAPYLSDSRLHVSSVSPSKQHDEASHFEFYSTATKDVRDDERSKDTPTLRFRPSFGPDSG